MNNPGTVIMVVSDLSKIEVEAEVDETDIAMVKLDQDVDISLDAFPDTTFEGRVTDIGNSARVTGVSAQDQVVNFLVTVLLLDKVEGIRPGMSSTVDITTAKADSVVKIPLQAVVMRSPEDTLTSGKEDSEDKGTVAQETSDMDADTEEEEPMEGVFLVNEGNAVFIPIVLGIADQQNIEVKEGVSEGDSIIVGSYKTLRTLKHDDAVQPEKSSRS
jgi:HlyD family secretion protein